ncbi:HSP20-like chaperone [Vararia minispora EC-137]|uniref:HSP20-like chaperone n=1 Tax=Vararia minispora EC-137 TaxID=1314806 RepID=A0ACB8QVZ5_9AGAM|nr:HSP20-like chaperone [Vararia minispora EC-137]
MPKCANRSCGQDYEDAANSEESCIYHPGLPIFHEGLKSWSCCNTLQKPVLDFDEFMGIPVRPGCTRGRHSATETQKAHPLPVQSSSLSATKATLDDKDGSTSNMIVQPPAPIVRPAGERMAPMASAPPKVAEEEEDIDAIVPLGTTCRHNGCNVTFSSDAENRIGDGPGTECAYHPGHPIFHEGSKGYFCCKPRVLEFDEFLKIKGCTQGRHVFIPKKAIKDKEELVDCRLDHYQTPSTVQVSVYAKKADKSRSVVSFGNNTLVLDLFLPDSKRFHRTLELFGPIDPTTSKFEILGTKVDIMLKKRDGRSWTLLEKTDRDLGGVALTFGVSGRTGTVGARQAVLDGENSRKA